MTRHWSLPIAILAAGGLLALAVSVPAAEPSPGRDGEEVKSPAQIQEELTQVLGALRRLRQGYYERKRAADERIASLAEQIAQLDERRARLTQEKEMLAEEVSTSAAETKRLREAGEKYDALCGEVRGVLRKFVQVQRKTVETGLPYRQEDRLVLLRRLTTELERDEMPLSGLVELAWLFAQGELREGAEGSSYSDKMSLPGGREKPARFCRLGHLFLGFVTEDGKEAGYAAPGKEGGFVWVTASPDEYGGQIRESVLILDRREPPRLLVLPLSVVPRKDVAGD